MPKSGTNSNLFFSLQGNGAKNLHHFKNFSSHFSKDTYPENTTTSDKIFHFFLKVQGFRQNFSEKIKKDRDRRQKCGRSLARSLPDSHGQPGYFAVFLNSHPAQTPAPGYFRASYSHSQKTFFLRDMKPLGLFVLPLYHRKDLFAMSAARTKPVSYPNDTQIKLNRRIHPRNFSAAPFGVWSLGELSRCVKGAQELF